MTLVEFLLARIADEEALARAAIGEDLIGQWKVNGDQGKPRWIEDEAPRQSRRGWSNVVIYDERSPALLHVAHWDPARVLAECEAKRQILRLHQGLHSCTYIEHHGECATITFLVSPYVDHEDFDPVWLI